MARDRNCATASCACLAQLGITLRRHWTRGMPSLYPRGVGEPPCAARGTVDVAPFAESSFPFGGGEQLIRSRKAKGQPAESVVVFS